MSLNVSLFINVSVERRGTGVFIRENGKNIELTYEKVITKFPGAELEEQRYSSNCVFDANITHNLSTMAKEVGIYWSCWRPEEIGAVYAKDIIPLLQDGLRFLKEYPNICKQFDDPNDWGTYDQFVPWVEEYLEACIKYPEAIIHVSR